MIYIHSQEAQIPHAVLLNVVVLEGCRRIHVGNQPVSLTPFLHPENHGVFCLSGTAFMFQPDKHVIFT